MNTPRRVLYHHRIRADDGQAVHVRELIRALRAQGHQVDECALVPKADLDPVSSSVAGAAAPSFWQRLSLPRAAVEVLEVGYNLTGRRMLRERARAARPDFVYERHALHLRAGLDVARELSVPLLLEVNSPMSLEMAQLGKLTLPRRARRTERLVLQGADAVLAVTEVLADMLIELGARREHVHVIGNGADPGRYDEAAAAAATDVRARLGLHDDAFALGFVGYMRSWHRLDLVLEVMRRPGFEALQLVLMGEGPALVPLLERARALGLAGRVRALGVVPPQLLPAHVMACDGALIPAINAYASPLKLFDSLLAGVVTIAPDQPNLRENLTDGEDGLLFQSGDVDALADTLARVVNDRTLATRIGAAGRQRLLQQRWTWAGNAERVLEIFERLRHGGSR